MAGFQFSMGKGLTRRDAVAFPKRRDLTEARSPFPCREAGRPLGRRG